MTTYTNFEIAGFHGFYNSLWNNADSDWCYFNDDDNLITLLTAELGITAEQAEVILARVGDSERCIGDYVEQHFTQYCKDVAAAYAPKYFEALADILQCEIEVTSQRLWSPRGYNFDTDRIFADLECDDEFVAKLLAKVNEHHKELEKSVKEDYQSGDGFVSFVPNQLSFWVATISDQDSSNRYRQLMMSRLARYVLDIENNRACWGLEDTLYSQIQESHCTQDQYYYIPDENKPKLLTFLTQL